MKHTLAIKNEYLKSLTYMDNCTNQFKSMNNVCLHNTILLLFDLICEKLQKNRSDMTKSMYRKSFNGFLQNILDLEDSLVIFYTTITNQPSLELDEIENLIYKFQEELKWYKQLCQKSIEEEELSDKVLCDLFEMKSALKSSQLNGEC